MAKVQPPPAERFDPIWGRWYTPGGALHDPARDAVDPAHGEPVQLVGPIPPELEGWTPPEPVPAPAPATPLTRVGRVLVALAALAAVLAAVVIVTFRSGECPDPGECTVTYAGGPVGWLAAAGLLALAFVWGRRALRGKV